MYIEDLFINENILVKEAILKIQETGKKIVFVTERGVLKGVVTDGDIRRWILKQGSLNDKVKFVMNKSPNVIKAEDKYRAKEIIRKTTLVAMPIVNEKNEILDVVFWHDRFDDEINKAPVFTNPLVIMAGGEGTRLYPYTKILPKPLIPIGDFTISERIINKYIEYGCNDVYITLNYKKNLIKSYFNDIDKKYNINYIEEKEYLGTAGSLRLLKGKINETFFVNNCDVIIEGDYSHMLCTHKKKGSKITIVTSHKNYTIPYGVINIKEGNRVQVIKEKPQYNFLVNTGMYILEPEVLDNIPINRAYDITDLIHDYLEKEEAVEVYIIDDHDWLDMGQFEELEAMRQRIEKF